MYIDTDVYHNIFIVPITMMIVTKLYVRCVRQINVLSIYLSIYKYNDMIYININ